jgi:NAD(P)-dependent dehydrogenase (short-subunit alcohol dehydrogenase family)
MKSYLIIGGSSGIGLALSKLLASEGHQVIATYFSSKPEESLKNIEYHHLDVLQDAINLEFLRDKINGMVYCPGAINLRPFARIKPESFRQDLELQTIGLIKVLQAAMPMFSSEEPASVVLFSTVAVQLGFSFHSQVAVSKGAIEGLTKSLAAELAPKVRVNAIAPSITQTRLAEKLLSTEEKIQANADRHPMNRIGSPEDIAATAAFLLSSQASWITGQILHVDGGKSTINN